MRHLPIPIFSLALGVTLLASSFAQPALAEATLVISQRPLEFEPGSKWQYCNPGIDTLGRVV